MQTGHLPLALEHEILLLALAMAGSIHHVAMSVKFDPEYDPHLDDMKLMQHDVFSTDESKQALRS